MIKNKHSIRGQYLVMPLNGKDKPFTSDDIQAYRNTSHYIVKFDSLKEYNNVPDDKVIDLNILIKAHLATEKKIHIKDMGKFGKGAFSSALISEGDKLIYSGLILSASDVADETKFMNNQHIYTFLPSKNSPEEIYVDGNFNECLSKYLQHMPSNADDYIINNGNESCLANFEAGKTFCRVHIFGLKLNIPVILLRATRTILANKLIGYDYGHNYWLTRKIAPTYFTEAGEPLNSYHFFCNSKPEVIQQSFSADVIENILEKKYYIDDNLLTIYPPESIQCIKNCRDYPRAGAIRIKVPAMVYLENDSMKIAEDATGQRLFMLPIKHSNVQSDEFLKNLTIGIGKVDGVLSFSLIVERVVNLTASEWLYLADFLNTILVQPMQVYQSQIDKSVDYKQLNLPIVQEENPIPLYSCTQTSFFKNIVANFNDKHSVFELMNNHSDDKRRNNLI